MPNLNPDAYLDSLRAEADAMFYRWVEKELTREWKERLRDVNKQPVASERAMAALDLMKEFLTRQVREWVSCYEIVARVRQRPEMFSETRLDEFRLRISSLVRQTVSGLRDQIPRNVWAGDLQTAIPYQRAELDVEKEILELADDELSRLKGHRSPVEESDSEDSAGRARQKTLIVTSDGQATDNREGSKTEASTSSPTASKASKELVIRGATQLPDVTDGQASPSWFLRLKAARSAAKLSRPDVAHRLKKENVYISAETIKKHEEGKAMPKPPNRKAYAAIYNLTEDDIFG